MSDLIIFVSGLFVSAVIGVLLSSRTDRRTTIRDAFLGGILGAVPISLVTLQLDLRELRKTIAGLRQNDALHRLDTYLSQTADGTPIRDSILAQRDALVRDAEKLLKGEITLEEPEEVVAEWERMFGRTATSVSATNLVTPDYWVGDSKFSQRQWDIHRATLDRGVGIRRIFIYDQPEQLKPDQPLAKIIRQQIDANIQVKVWPYEKVTAHRAFLTHSPSIRGAIDFVVFDSSAALLTFPHPRTREITSGLLTSERGATDAALQLFEELWRSADKVDG